MFFGQGYKGQGHGGKSILPGQVGFQAGSHGIIDERADGVKECIQHIIFTAEVEIDGAPSDSGAFGDSIDISPIIAKSRDLSRGGIQYGTPLLLPFYFRHQFGHTHLLSDFT
jgi:hypothetical protein